MSHGPHESLPGYSPGQILVDGCHECESRGRKPDEFIGMMDSATFNTAWRRTHVWNTDGLDDVSHAEARTLRVLWSVQVRLEQRGVPAGTLPGHA